MSYHWIPIRRQQLATQQNRKLFGERRGVAIVVAQFAVGIGMNLLEYGVMVDFFLSGSHRRQHLGGAFFAKLATRYFNDEIGGIVVLRTDQVVRRHERNQSAYTSAIQTLAT